MGDQWVRGRERGSPGGPIVGVSFEVGGGNWAEAGAGGCEEEGSFPLEAPWPGVSLEAAVGLGQGLVTPSG